MPMRDTFHRLVLATVICCPSVLKSFGSPSPLAAAPDTGIVAVLCCVTSALESCGSPSALAAASDTGTVLCCPSVLACASPSPLSMWLLFSDKIVVNN